MDYKNAASGVIDAIGGKENVVSAAHCATRLRLVIADDEKVDKKTLENVEGVKGVFAAQGQLQIIFGTGAVNKVYDEFITLSGVEAASKAEVKEQAAKKGNPFQRAIKTLGDIFVPIIPAIVASGLLMGLMSGISAAVPSLADNGTFQLISLFANAAFVFLPVLIAMSAAKTFGGNQYLGAVIGMIMIHTNLVNAWSYVSYLADPAGNAAIGAQLKTYSVWFGLYSVNNVGYQGHVIPVVIAVWFMCFLEKKLHKVVPEMFDLFVTPLVTVLVTGYLTLTIIGPVFATVENGILGFVTALIAIPFGIGAFAMGAIYAPTVVLGIHHMYNALEAGMISSMGYDTWMPIASAANVAQGAACLAVALRTKNAKLKDMALPASLSAFLGITEPSIFGVNLRFMKPFIAACIGGACGACVSSILKVSSNAYGITGLFGFLTTIGHTGGYAITIAVAFVVAFAISWVLKIDEEA